MLVLRNPPSNELRIPVEVFTWASQVACWAGVRPGAWPNLSPSARTASRAALSTASWRLRLVETVLPRSTARAVELTTTTMAMAASTMMLPRSPSGPRRVRRSHRLLCCRLGYRMLLTSGKLNDRRRTQLARQAGEERELGDDRVGGVGVADRDRDAGGRRIAGA